MPNEIEKHFSTKTGKNLANLLVEHIVRTENPLNWDECAFSIGEELCNRADKGNTFPVGAIIRGEIRNHIDNNMKQRRIFVTINEVN
jgi:hypothetical protein